MSQPPDLVARLTGADFYVQLGCCLMHLGHCEALQHAVFQHSVNLARPALFKVSLQPRWGTEDSDRNLAPLGDGTGWITTRHV
jgi:hypothetical protein